MGSVVNLRKDKYDVYIGRGSKWGNMFVMGRDGNRDEVIDKYERKIRKDEYLMSCLGELEDKVLGCYCKPLRCHGDILIKLLDERRMLCGVKSI